MLGFDKGNLKFIGPCPICKAQFDEGNIAVLRNEGQTSLLHIDCQSCESSLIMTLIKNNAGVVTNVGVLTDLKKEDFRRFNDLPAITVDEVLEFQKHNKNDNIRTKK